MFNLTTMTDADWTDAQRSLTRSQFAKLKRVARAGCIKIPIFVAPASQPRVLVESISDIADFDRRKNVVRVEQYNKEVLQWAKKVERELKASAMSRFGHRSSDKTDTLFPSLADSIKANIKLDNKTRTEARSVGFSLARHGVFLQKGARVGKAGDKGSRWTNKQYRTVRTKEESLGKLRMSDGTDWFNDILDRNMDELASIVANYSADIAIKKLSMYIL